MSEQVQRVRAPAGAVIVFVLGAVALAVATLFASTMGRFLSYAAFETTKSDAAFNALMVLAVFGPFVIALACVVWGIGLLAKGKHGWWTTGVGIVALLVNFNVATAALVS